MAPSKTAGPCLQHTPMRFPCLHAAAHLTIALCATALPNVVRAQPDAPPAVSAGRVVERGTGRLIPGLVVVALNLYDSTIVSAAPDERGLFSMGLPTGVYQMTFVASDGALAFGPVDTLAPGEVVEREYAIQLAERPNEITYSEVEVQRQAAMVRGSAPPAYPPDLALANVEGEVLVRFVVGARGRADMSTFRVLRSTNPGFARSVREFTAHTRFTPALVGGRPVPQVVQLPMQFTLPDRHR